MLKKKKKIEDKNGKKLSVKKFSSSKSMLNLGVATVFYKDFHANF